MTPNRAWPVPAALLLALVTAGSTWAASPGPISEETPPAVCDPGSFVVGVRCTGDFCDNVQISCARLPGADLGRAGWTRWVSEEQGRRACPGGSLIAGLACNGRYCDNLSLYCVEVRNLRLSSCSASPSVSEEHGGTLSFLAAKGVDKAGERVAARGLTCTGRYCDNKSFDLCYVTNP